MVTLGLHFDGSDAYGCFLIYFLSKIPLMKPGLFLRRVFLFDVLSLPLILLAKVDYWNQGCFHWCFVPASKPVESTEFEPSTDVVVVASCVNFVCHLMRCSDEFVVVD